MISRNGQTGWIIGCAIAATLIILLINPVGYRGAGADDFQYLVAADCWVSHGICLPTNHWSGRWPVFAPMAWLISAFGRTRTVVEVWPLVASTLALISFGAFMRRFADIQVALVAMILLAITPAFSTQFVEPAVEPLELCTTFAAALAAYHWWKNGSGWSAFMIGLCVGIGFQIRETALAGGAVIAVALLLSSRRPDWRSIILAGAGFLIPLGIEMLVYFWQTDDPFFRRRLSLAHGTIPSTELSPTTDTSRSPLFNPEFIAHWRREPGIYVHWSIDGPLNLVLNGFGGFALLLTPPLALLAKFNRQNRSASKALRLWGLAVLYVLIINYAFAMDPKPRVMLPAIALADGALALAMVALLHTHLRPFAITLFGLMAMANLSILYFYIRPSDGQTALNLWLRKFPNQIMGDINVRRMFILDPRAGELSSLNSTKPLFVAYYSKPCKSWPQQAGLERDEVELIDQQPLNRRLPVYDIKGSVCLFRARQHLSHQQLINAYGRTWRQQGAAP